jgi:hypothetical protein
VERVAVDRVQQMIDDEAAQRFPAGAVPRLVLLQYGDHPVVEPGEVYLRVIFGQDLATPRAWMDEYGERLEDFRAQRLPEVKGFVFTSDDTAARRPVGIMKMDDLSLLDREADEIARGLIPVEPVLLGSRDLATWTRWSSRASRLAARRVCAGAWRASVSSRRTRSSASDSASPARWKPGRA